MNLTELLGTDSLIDSKDLLQLLVRLGFNLVVTSAIVGLDSLSFAGSAEALVMLILGGAGRLHGALIGAVLFTVLAVTHVPALAVILVPFAALVAMSRVVLGLHYPSDVLVGALLGAALAAGSLALFN